VAPLPARPSARPPHLTGRTQSEAATHPEQRLGPAGIEGLLWQGMEMASSYPQSYPRSAAAAGGLVPFGATARWSYRGHRALRCVARIL